MKGALASSGRLLRAACGVLEDGLGTELCGWVGENDPHLEGVSGHCFKGWIADDLAHCTGNAKRPRAFVCIALNLCQSKSSYAAGFGVLRKSRRCRWCQRTQNNLNALIVFILTHSRLSWQQVASHPSQWPDIADPAVRQLRPALRSSRTELRSPLALRTRAA